MGIITLTARVLPRWVGLTITVSTTLAALAPLETTGAAGIILNILLSDRPVAAGYALWTGQTPGKGLLS